MITLWTVLTTSALALALAGWVPRSVRPAPTIVAAVAVLTTGGVAVSVLGPQQPMVPVFGGAAVGLVIAVWHRVPHCAGLVRRRVHELLTVSFTVAAVGLVSAGAADAAACRVSVHQLRSSCRD